jgi:hypothetical protein
MSLGRDAGLGTFVHRNDPALTAYVIDNAIEILGSERLMFGSNFPIEKAVDRPCRTDPRASRCRGKARRAPRGEHLLEHRGTNLADLIGRGAIGTIRMRFPGRRRGGA